ncbi:MAG: hypothetical protein K0M70_15350, partial [Arenimonas sp.]|nr:hypothetical protein [Arenimonas sp.]
GGAGGAGVGGRWWAVAAMAVGLVWKKWRRAGETAGRREQGTDMAKLREWGENGVWLGLFD